MHVGRFTPTTPAASVREHVMTFDGDAPRHRVAEVGPGWYAFGIDVATLTERLGALDDTLVAPLDERARTADAVRRDS